MQKKHLKNSTLTPNKTLKKLGLEKNFLNLKKNPIANIILNSEKLNTFLLILETRQRYMFSPLFFNMVLEILTFTVSRERKLKESNNATDLYTKLVRLFINFMLHVFYCN